MSYLVNLNKSEDLITLIKSYIDDERMVNALRCVEGDFVKYYGVYCYSKPLKFMMHLLKSLFQDNQYDLSQIGDNRQGSVGYVCTTEYLFEDNLRPVINQLSNYDVLSTKIFIIVRRQLSLNNFREIKGCYSIANILKINRSYISIKNIMLLIYLRFVAIPKAISLISYLETNLNHNYKLIISADPCDTFSRALAIVFSKRNVKYILLQSGPTETDSVEWKSVICDTLIAWQSSLSYFTRHNINVQSFFPPRFYNAVLKKPAAAKYDVVIFLPWVSETTDRFDVLINDISIIINVLSKKEKLKCFVKYHPAMRIDISNLTGLFEEITSEQSVGDVIASSRMILNFGSTVTFDADIIGVKTGVINFHEYVPMTSQFFELSNVANIRNVDDLVLFWHEFRPVKREILRNLDFIDYTVGYLNSVST